MQKIILLVGTMVGAGFASGKEISTFFLSSNQYAILGLILSNIITIAIIYKIIHITKEKEIQNYQELIHAILPPKLSYIAGPYNQIINLFLLISFYIMIAGFATYFKQETTLPILAGALLAILCTYVACKGNIQTITKINTLVIPMLILTIIHIWAKNVDNRAIQTMILEEKEGKFLEAILKALLYSSYNSIILTPIAIEIGKTTKSKTKAKHIAIGTGIILLTLGYLLCTLLFQAGTTTILQKDLPILEIVGMLESNFQKIYGIMIAIAIITSAISALYGYLKNITRTEKSYRKWLLVLSLSAIPIAHIGFSNLINTLYPIFGIIGSIQILLLFKQK